MVGLGRSRLHSACSAACTFDEQSTLAHEAKTFIHRLINETAAHDLVSVPRKEATMYLVKAAIERCTPGAIVETGVYMGGSSITIMRSLMDMDRCDRQFWAFDSFEGFPQIQAEDMNGGLTTGTVGQFNDTSQEIFEARSPPRRTSCSSAHGSADRFHPPHRAG